MIDYQNLKKLKKEEPQKKKPEKRKGEPGIKVPIALYKQIGQFCDICDDTKAHYFDMDRKNKMCSYCGTITSFAKSTKDTLSKIIIKPIGEQYYTLLNLFI